MITLFVNRLTVLDASLLDPERGLLGESWLVDAELEGSLDHQGMVLDFSDVKRRLKQIIDQRFDHRLLIPGRTHTCRIETSDSHCQVEMRLPDGGYLNHRSPLDAVTVIDAPAVDGDSLAAAITNAITPQLPDNVRQLRLRLTPESIDGAWYRYSHGLKHHAGNCQRIAHGHRSRIEILRDGVRDPALEQAWAERWKDIYLGTRGDLLETFDRDGIAHCRFGYTASQGRFELVLPRARCDLVDTDSTVENLARHIADALAQDHPGSRFRVRAFEGVDKGAVATAGSPP